MNESFIVDEMLLVSIPYYPLTHLLAHLSFFNPKFLLSFSFPPPPPPIFSGLYVYYQKGAANRFAETSASKKNCPSHLERRRQSAKEAENAW